MATHHLPDLHRHLDGSLRASTVRELARAAGREMPPLLAFHPGLGLGEALERFSFTLALLQNPNAVKRVAAEICEDAALEGVTTLEIRFAPQLHRGAALEAVVDAALEGVNERAGLILCGLYGESPEDIMRLVHVAESRPGVVGIDVACAPLPEHRWGLTDYAAPFHRAADIGLGRTIHAGEGRPPEEIRQAVEMLGVERIGHGTTLLTDLRVLDLVIETQTVIEVCLTSNWHTGVIESLERHPVPEWLRRGVRACICTDNTLFSETTAAVEHDRAARLQGMTPEMMNRVIDIGHKAAFVRT
jgi:adenosine deaminase